MEGIPVRTTDFMRMSHAQAAMKASDIAYENEQLRQQLAEKDAVISLLQFALADTEALEIGTAERLAASQARGQKLREALNHHHEIGLGRGRDKSHSLSQLIISGYKHGPLFRITEQALALPADTSALSALIAKAGEVMQERCWMTMLEHYGCNETGPVADAIRALPGVKLEDLK